MSPPGDKPSRTSRAPVATVILVVLCVGAYLACLSLGKVVDGLILVCCGAKDRALIIEEGQWWRLVSAGFLHGNLIHLVVNMAALVSIGRLVERLWGTPRFLLIYLVSLIGGNVASLAATPGISVGASGAILGLFGALAAYSIRYRHLLAPRGRWVLWVNMAVVAAAQVAIGLLVPFIDNAAHAGGALTGAALAIVLRPESLRQPGRVVREFAVRLAVFAVAVITAFALSEAAGHAVRSQWLTVARSGFHTVVARGGEFSLMVPQGWRYEPPTRPHGQHVFIRPGVAAISVRVVPPRQGLDPLPVADSLKAQYLAEGLEFLASRNITVGGQPGIEMLFRRQAGGRTQRHREVVFPAWAGGELFCFSAVCLEERYRLLELLFDQVLQSIEARPPQPQSSPAREVWRRVLENPRDADAAVALAGYYIAEGRRPQAERLLLSALAASPDHAVAHERLAWLYATSHPPLLRPAQAVRHARRAVELRPREPRYLATLAIALEANGQPDEALAAAREARDLAPDDAALAELVERLRRRVARNP